MGQIIIIGSASGEASSKREQNDRCSNFFFLFSRIFFRTQLTRRLSIVLHHHLLLANDVTNLSTLILMIIFNILLYSTRGLDFCWTSWEVNLK